MKKYFLFLFIILLQFFASPVFALDIIFPQKNPHTTKAKESYFLGNVAKKSKLTINNAPVKLYKNGAFCHIVEINDGINKFVLKEKNGKKTITKIYTINKNIPTSKETEKSKRQEKITYDTLRLANIITDRAPIRNTPSDSGKRISHLPNNTKIIIEEEYKNWYKINNEDSNDPLWIHKNNAKIMYPINNRYKATIQTTEYSEDINFQYIKINFDIPIPYKIEEKNNDIYITFWGIKDISNIEKSFCEQQVFKDIKVNNFEKNNATILISSKEIICGYSATYEKNTFIFKKRKTPIINKQNPLKNIVIAIDAGHGGKELGTVGPTRVPEKDVNLKIALKLEQELMKNGAKVIMTRKADDYTEIYTRPDIADKNNALFSISIHSNSMVDGNPYKKNGTSVFYYNEHAKLFADTIKKQMLKDLKLRDDGTNYASFVLTRPTNPISILIEVAYMPNPNEYFLLKNDNFQTKTAESILEGIKNYLQLMQNYTECEGLE